MRTLRRRLRHTGVMATSREQADRRARAVKAAKRRRGALTARWSSLGSLGRGTVGPEGPDGPQVSRGFGTDTSVGAWAGAPAPPLPLTGDTGATSPGWSIDWLAVTIWGVDADRVARLVSEAFHLGREVGVEGWTLLGGARFYGRRHEYLGATLLSECQSKGAEDNVHVVLPGDACAVGVDALLQLLTRLKMWSSRCAVVRLDLAVDSVPFTPLDAYRAVLAGQTVSWVKRGRDGLVMHTWTSSNGPGRATRSMSAVDRHGAAFASTTDEGRHGSSWRQRTRTRTPSWSVFSNGAATTLSWRGSWWGCLREFCDFGAQDGTHGARNVKLLPWWAAFVGVRGSDRRSWSLTAAPTCRWIARSTGSTVPSCRAWRWS